MTKPGVKITIDQVGAIAQSIEALAGRRVLVGIPEAKTTRREPGITNAALGYIHEHGAPEAGIPARAWLVPGVENGVPNASPYLEQAGRQALAGNLPSMERNLEAAGQVTVSAVRQKLQTGPFVPLAPATIRARRRRSKGSKYRRKATGAADVKPLLDTRQMVGAVSSVVRKA